MTRFSTTRTTPSFDLTPMAVVPSCTQSAISTVNFYKDLIMPWHARSCSRHVMMALQHSDVVQTEPSLEWNKPHLNGLQSVFNLKQSSLWTEGVDASIILTSCEEHDVSCSWSGTAYAGAFNALCSDVSFHEMQGVERPSHMPMMCACQDDIAVPEPHVMT